MGTRLYVGNLPFQTDESALRELFGSDGRSVTDVKIVTDRDTGRSRGFGFVEMANEDDAKSAIETFNGYNFDGRSLTVNEARERTGGGGGGGGGGYRGGGGGGGFGGGGGGGYRGGGGGGGGGYRGGGGGSGGGGGYRGAPSGGGGGGGYRGNGGGFTPRDGGFAAAPPTDTVKAGRGDRFERKKRPHERDRRDLDDDAGPDTSSSDD